MAKIREILSRKLRAAANPSRSQVLVRARSSFQSAEEIRAALLTAKLLGMIFSGSGGAGHWDFVDLEVLGVRELLGSCAAVIVSSVVL